MSSGTYKRTFEYRQKMSIILKGKNRKKRLKTNCDFCEKKIEYLLCKKKYKHKFCNKRCSDKWKVKNYPKIIGEFIAITKNIIKYRRIFHE